MQEPSSTIIRRGLLIFLALLVLGLFAYGWYNYSQLEEKLAQSEATLASTTETLNSQISELEEELAEAEEENEELEDDLEDERERNDELAERVEEVTGAVGTLEETVATDPELLKKYSRTFFLSENYLPSDLVDINDEYAADNRDLEFHERALPYLEDLLEAAEDDDVELRIVSAYRSFGTQRNLNDRYTRVYGTGANQFSAEQGYSEHQLGTTVDFTTPELGVANFTNFASTEAYDWLLENAHEYGFVLSYPQGNQFYVFEPWHWRFVGEELAEDLSDENAHFYDWSQREIDSYRSELFN